MLFIVWILVAETAMKGGHNEKEHFDQKNDVDLGFNSLVAFFRFLCSHCDRFSAKRGSAAGRESRLLL